MGVIVDVVLAVAMVTVTAGAVAEFQIGVGRIGTAAYGAAVGVVCFCGAFGKGNCAGLFLGRRLFAGNVIQEGEQIHNVFACKQQIIQKTYQRKQTVWQEGDRVEHVENGDCGQQQIHKTQEPCFYRQNKENEEGAVRTCGGKHQKQAQMQIPTHIGIDDISEIVNRNSVTIDHHIHGGAEEHGEDIHHQNAGEIEKIELKSAKRKLYMPAQTVEEIEEDQNHKGVGAGVVGQNKCDKPPHLTL